MIPSIEIGNKQFPSDDTNPKKRGKEWFLQFAQASYSEGLGSFNDGPYSAKRRSDMSTLRSYGAGSQEQHQYKDRFFGSLNKDTVGENLANLRDGMANINWEIFSVAPKFMNILKGMFDDLHLVMDARAIDENSLTEKQSKKWRLWTESQNAKWVEPIEQAIGQEIIKKRDWTPTTREELNMYESIGGFKLALEVGIEKLLQACFELSDWDEETKDLLIEDLVNLGVIVAQDYLEKATGLVKTRYIDPAVYVATYSRVHGFKKSPFMGHVQYMTIGEIRDSNDLKQEDVEQIISSFRNEPLGTAYDWDRDDSLVGDKWWCDDYSIPVFFCEYKCTDKKYMKNRVNKNGEEVYARTRHGSSDADIVKTQMLYSCKWVVGTEIVFDCGPAFYTKRNKNSEVEFSYHAFAITGKSFTEICRPLYDQVQMNWLKFQNALAKSPVKGVAIELGALANMSMAGSKMEPYQMIQLRNIDGTLLYRGTGLRTTGQHQTGPPIRDLEGGIGNQLNEFITTNEWLLSQIREQTGVTAAVAAGGNQDQRGLGLNQMDAQSTSNVLKPMFKCYQTLKQNAATGMLTRLQQTLRTNKKMYKGYYPIVGKTAVDAVKLIDGMDVARIGIFIKASADAKQRAEFLMAAMESLKAGKNGMPGIQYSDFFFLKRTIEGGGSLTYAQSYLSYRENIVKQEMDAKAMEHMQIQNQGTQEGIARKAEAELAKINAKALADQETYTKRIDDDIRYQETVNKLPSNATTTV